MDIAFTDGFEDDGKDHECLHGHKEKIKPNIILRSNAISHPGAVMIIDADTSFTYLAMSRSFRFQKLSSIENTMQSKHIFDG